MADLRDSEYSTTRNDYGTLRDDYVEPRSGSMMWTLVLGGLVALGLIFAFGSWDSGPVGTQTSMSEQAVPGTQANPPAIEPAPAPRADGNTAQPTTNP